MSNSCKYCKKDKNPRSPHRSFFNFPKDSNAKKQWCSFFDLNEDTIKPTNKICSDHFETKFLKNSGNRILLTQKAYPTIKISSENTAKKRINFDDSNESQPVMKRSAAPNTDISDNVSNCNNYLIINVSINDVDRNVSVPINDAISNASALNMSSSDSVLINAGVVNHNKRPVAQTVRHNYLRDDFTSESAFNDFLKYKQYREHQFNNIRNKLYRVEKINEQIKKENADLKEKLFQATAHNYKVNKKKKKKTKTKVKTTG